ncbi:MAG: hypothetical protein ABS36_09010 [Acidobacteria bacterium SCN 69-37]|nr:MAG: hypothetical protein ABS36_09010 [Acidobacteria bacterium SCN 69-37]
MTIRAALLVCAALAVMAAGCGKKGNPLPPLRPVPARIADMTATRTAGKVELRFTVPNMNLDGTTPVAIDHVDIFALRSMTPGATPPPAGQVSGNPRNLIDSLAVRRPLAADAGPSGTPVSEFVPLPGDVATYVADTAAAEQAGASAIFYVVVPVAGSGRGRPGPPTPVANVPLGPLPGAATQLVLEHDATELRATWTAPGEGVAYRVFAAPAKLLTPTPVTTASFSMPVTFGEEICLTVQTITVTGAITVAGASTERVCTTPVDRYPPTAPAGLRVIQEGPVVTLLWDTVEAADLAGYVILRGEGTTDALTPIVREPVTATTFRDTSAVAGTTYTYAVAAVDTASVPNVSEPSARETITVR